MGMGTLGSRAVIGDFYQALAADPGAAWVAALSMLFNSDQDSEDYAWIGQSSAMREWVGGRHAKGFRESGLTIKNKHFEATIEVQLSQMRRDKTGQANVRIRELAARTNSHWAKILSELIVGGESQLCYDGQFFFDTDHQEGKSGVQSNDIITDISTLPALVNGTAASPSPEEAQQCIMRSVTQILSYKDDVGEPMNEGASSFLVMVPIPYFIAFSNAMTMPKGTGVSEQKVPNDFNVSVVTNVRLPWTDKFATFRTDGSVKPFIRQQETSVDMKVKGAGTDFEFDNDAHQYGVDTWRNVGNGYWQHACLNQLT